MVDRSPKGTPDPQSMPVWQRTRRDEIVVAAVRLLDRQTYDQIQIKDVAKDAGVALATLYRYFRSKELLYAAVLTEWTSWQDGPLVAGDTAEDRLRCKVRLLISSVEKRPNFFTMELALQSTTDPQVKELQSAWSRAGAAWLVSDLQVLGEERSRQTAVMMWAVVNHVLKQATLHGEPFEDGLATTEAFIELIAGPLADAEKEHYAERRGLPKTET